MKKTAPLCFVFFLFLLLSATSAFALLPCVPPKPERVIMFDGDECRVSDTDLRFVMQPKTTFPDKSLYRDYDREEAIDGFCPSLTNQKSRDVVFELLASYRLEGYDGNFTIEKQTDAEYSEFQKEMKKVNSSVCNCDTINLRERKGVWTSYSYGIKDSCYSYNGCRALHSPPLYCPNAKHLPHLTAVLIIAWGVIAGLFFLVKGIRNHKRGKK